MVFGIGERPVVAPTLARQEIPRTAPVAAPATAPDVGVRFAAAAPAEGGRSDVTTLPDGTTTDVAGEVARLRVENAALRQSSDVLRNQLAILSERIERLEGKFGALTGSIDPAPAVPRLRPAETVPPVTTTGRDVATTRATVTAAPRTEFGIELGSYGDLTAVKAAWRRLLADKPDLFGDLEALATVRDRGGATELLLVAGPFTNAADAADRCTRVEDAGLACLPAFYLGQALAIR
nr:SPOR domain-containing protein [Oharaeibacter diazotrophicus]